MKEFEHVWVKSQIAGETHVFASVYFPPDYAILGLNEINHIENQQNCYLDFLLTNIYEDFRVSESLNPLWKNEAYHTAIEYSLFIHEHQRPNDCEYEKIGRAHV